MYDKSRRESSRIRCHCREISDVVLKLSQIKRQIRLPSLQWCHTSCWKTLRLEINFITTARLLKYFHATTLTSYGGMRIVAKCTILTCTSRSSFSPTRPACSVNCPSVSHDYKVHGCRIPLVDGDFHKPTQNSVNTLNYAWCSCFSKLPKISWWKDYNVGKQFWIYRNVA